MEENTVLQRNFILAKLSIGYKRDRVRDKRVTDETNKAFGTKDGGDFIKRIFRAPEYAAMKKALGNLRTYHYKATVRFEDGAQLLPNRRYNEYVSEYNKFVGAATEGLDAFIKRYDEATAEERKHLNGMFNPKDYPSADQFVSDFHVSVVFDPVPSTGNVLVDMEKEDLDEFNKQLTARNNEAVQNAMKEVWERLYEVVKTCSRTLREKKSNGKYKTFHDTLIQNVVEQCKFLKDLNVTGDENLEKLRQEVEKEFSSVDPKEIREGDKVREDVATVADNIIKKMSGYMMQPE